MMKNKSVSSSAGIAKKPKHAALRKGRISLPRHAYVVTTVVHGRAPIFTDFNVACAAARCFVRPAFLGDAVMLAWVLMPDHAHWLIQLGDSDDLSMVVSRLKSASARAVNRILGRNGRLWAATFHDRALRREDDLRIIARYIVSNPLRAGIVERISDYSFWDAVWLE
jgi:putative transposase